MPFTKYPSSIIPLRVTMIPAPLGISVPDFTSPVKTYSSLEDLSNP